jgi:hypothetical protein
MVHGINNAGAITGVYTVANGRQFGFVRDPQGKFTSFDPDTFTFASSINNEGAITGTYAKVNLVNSHGFVRSPEGTITSFDPPFCLAGSNTIPRSINDKGVTTGDCTGATPLFPLVGWVRIP